MTQYIQNYQEVLYYDSIYAFALKDDSDALSGKAAVTFLKKSNLSAEDIRRIWISVLPSKSLQIDKESFRNMMRCIALVQEGYNPSDDLLSRCVNKNVNFAELDGIPVFQPINRALRRFAVQSFNKLSSGDYIDGKVSVNYLKDFNLDRDTLKSLWMFVDFDSKLRITQEQWEICILLAAYINRGHPFSQWLLLEALQQQPEVLVKPSVGAEAISSSESTDLLGMNEEVTMSVPMVSTQWNMMSPQQQMVMNGMQQMLYPPQQMMSPQQLMSPQQQMMSPQQQMMNPPQMIVNNQPLVMSPLQMPSQHQPISQQMMSPQPIPVNPPQGFSHPPSFPTSPQQIPDQEAHITHSPSQPSSLPGSPQQTPSLHEWIQKADIVWTRFTDRILQTLPSSPLTLKNTIRGLRSLEVDVNELKQAVAVLLKENPELETIDPTNLKRLLILLKDPHIEPEKPLYLCDIPSIPSDQAFCDQAQAALERIREEIKSLKTPSSLVSPSSKPNVPIQLLSPSQGPVQPPRPLLQSGDVPSRSDLPPKKDFYEKTKDLFDSLLRKGDLREIQQLQSYLTVQAQIRDLMNKHAPIDQVRRLQKTIPNPIEIMKMYTSREPVPDALNEIKKRLDTCDVSMIEYTKRFIPDDPVVFVEMNDLETYLELIDQLSFCTDIVELASVKENALFVQHWMKLLLECRKILEECQQWVDGVDEDIRQDVLRDAKVRTWIQNLQWCIRVAQRVDDTMTIIGNEMEGYFEECEKIYKEIITVYNEAQKDDTTRMEYQRLIFDYRDKCTCQLCLHASRSDRSMGSLLGRKYHPECANLWITRIENVVPVFVAKEDSLY